MHNGSQDMRELGRRGGRATPKAKRADAQRETLREFLRREADSRWLARGKLSSKPVSAVVEVLGGIGGS